MCLIACAWRAHPDYELVLAANRDEFHERPPLAAAAWQDAPDVHGGRDALQGGGWLAVSARRRLAAVTNVRRMQEPDPSAPSRGALVADFVRGNVSARAQAERLTATAERYAGFNLLLWDDDALVYVSNQPTVTVRVLPPGIHAVSNAQLETPWPKLRRLRTSLETVCREAGEPAPLWQTLADTTPPDDDELPDTGVGLETERFLAPPFIRGRSYGPRASTLVWSRAGRLTLEERRFGPDGIAQGHTQLALPAP